KRSFYGTISYMPAIFGLYASAEVINKLITVK
ncbi:MAG TPA: tRNA threonylcarbamoyladenosine dehydratase, partial [Flavobacteriia bacterium]|nr:tRNA threonylcarbamoyladenosine dehydratase [Flavobacteriia bacterium]